MKGSSAPWLIEFAGPAGVGKSTLADMLVQRLSRAGWACPAIDTYHAIYRANSMARKIKAILPARQGDFAILAAALSMMQGRTGGGWRRFKKMALLHARKGHLEDVQRQFASPVIVLDQWLIQYLWSTCGDVMESDLPKLKRLFENVYCGWRVCLVWVEADEQVIVSRLQARKKQHCPYDHVTDTEKLRMIRNYQVFRERVKSLFPCLHIESIRVDVSGVEHACDDKLFDAITSKLGS